MRTGMKNVSACLTVTGAPSAIFCTARRAPRPWPRTAREHVARRQTRVETGLPGSANTAAPELRDAEPQRLARPLRDLMENGAHAQIRQGSRHQIEAPHGHAAAQDEHIVRVEVKFEPRLELVEVIAHVIVRDALETLRASARRQCRRRWSGGSGAAEPARPARRARCRWRSRRASAGC